MWCASVLYLVATILVVTCSLPPVPCVFTDNKRAYCGRDDVNYTLAFIPPISQDITYINMQGQPLKQLPYNGFRNLSSQSTISSIWLAHCQISHVDAGALVNLHNLTIIDFAYNDINRIDSKLFSDTEQIEYIFMEYNKIEVVPSGLFQNLLLLELVSLHHNRIHRVERFSFKNTPSLRRIYLNNNQIGFMSMSFKDEFDNLTSLRLGGNPWQCNCELGPLYEFLIKMNMLNLFAPVKCDKPSTLQGRYWKDISRDIFVCRSDVTMSTVDSVMNDTEPVTTTEHGDNMPVTVYNERYQQVDTGVPQPPSHENWIPYTVSVLVLVDVAAVIIGVMFVVRYTRAKSNRRRLLGVRTLVEQGSDRLTHARPVDSGMSMRDVHSSAGSAGSE